jgi:hypothetical protein
VSLRSPLALLLATLVGTLLFTAALASPASAARKCKLSTSEQRNLGANYTTKLRVKGVSCKKGKRVSRAFHKCRKSNGGWNGRCKRRVLRFRCSENRFAAIKTNFSANVTCKRGGKRVWFTYTMIRS